MKKLVLILLVFFTAVYAQNKCQFSFDEGLAFYQKGNFSAAKKSWESCEEKSAELFYHLGNVYFQTQQWGLAILNFEKAILFDPSLEDAHFNLKLAEAKKLDTQKNLEIEQKEVAFLWSLYNSLDLNSMLWSLFGIFVLFLMMVFCVYQLKGGVQKLSYAVAVLCVLFFVPIGVVAAYKVYVKEWTLYAICLGHGVGVHAEQNVSSTKIREINEGTKIEVLQESDAWLLIKLGEEVQGFVRRSDVGLIR